jgi:NADH dehydrogenase (ubiquinone) 1 beta subcomplex subunit 3
MVTLYIKMEELILWNSEAWRYTGPFSRRNRFRGMFPGFGIAAVAFAAYCGYEYVFLQDNHHGHGDNHH